MPIASSRTTSSPNEVVDDEQPGGGTATYGVRREHEADLVDEAGAEQRPIQLAAAVDTDPLDVVVGGEDVEEAGQVHAIGAGRQVRDPVTVEQREVRVGRCRGACDEDPAPERHAEQPVKASQPTPAVDDHQQRLRRALPWTP